MSSPVVSNRTPTGQIIQKDGTATFAFLKWMQNIGSTVNVAFDSEGNYQGAIGDQATIDGRETLASIVQYISTDGVVQGPGIDFALPYLNKDTDHIADGSGSPLAGGKVAYTALVASGPIAGQTIRFNGSAWLPVAIAVSKVFATHRWINSYDASTGQFATSQPDFADISGSLDPSQLPANIAYIDHANVFTANQAITGDLTVSGNISSANFPPPQVYPAAGVAVSSGAAWTTSIPAADVARVGSNNHFTASQTITGALNVSGNIVGNSISGYPFNAATPSAMRVITGATALVGGTFTITFANPFATGSVCVVISLIAGGIGSTPPSIWIFSADQFGFTVNSSSATATDGVFWAAFGNS